MKILGLDLGTNSIGWALVEQDFEAKSGKILGLGSRIIPMSQDVLGKFDSGNSVSQTAERTGFRGIRRLRERHLLRRERLHRVLNLLGFLPDHYVTQIDFEKHFGQFIDDSEPKLVYDANNQFIFKNSFKEMLDDFRQRQPQLLVGKKGGPAIVPYDWTIYYLRKKALTHKIEKEELAWIILNFNQKRGYYQLRGEEEEENPNKSVVFHSLKIVDVVADEQPNTKGDLWYSLHLENGWIYRRSSKTPLFDWKDKARDFIVTTDLNDDGTVKLDSEGKEKRSFRAPAEEDWTLLKKKTEADIEKSQRTVGTFIYETLLQNPSQKIRGKLVRTIERKFYKDELMQILEKQKEFHSELQNVDLYSKCVRELYKNNEIQQMTLSKRDFVHLFLDDIIFYQRPLRSQKSTIGNCSLEYRPMKDKNGVLLKDENGKQVIKPLKVIPKSHPLYQEFRVWQWLFNLKIYKKDDDTDVTSHFINGMGDLVNLFDFLMTQKEVNHKDILLHLFAPKCLKGKLLNAEIAKYRWNYVFDDSKEKEEEKSKTYPCNETGYEIKRRLSKVVDVPTGFFTPDVEQKLWHIIYSVTDKTEFEKALETFALKHRLDRDSFVENFKKFPPFKSEYGAFSEKAIKKLLPLMRLGKYWSWDAIDPNTKKRIEKIITGEYDEKIKERVREKAVNLAQETHFQGLQLWLAQYIVYDRHSEAGMIDKWNSVDDLDEYVKEFKQHSLRNPIVEQIITETLRVVREIWKQYGNGVKDFFDEIHIELGREMKNTAEERKRLSDMVSENENTNLRIKALLSELKNDNNIENVRPFSPIQQELLKIYEDGVLNSDIEIPEDILKISKTAQPTSSELLRYKLWLEQKYCSPYTGEMIPLGKLFTSEYEIEHIIPQSRYFDDSFSNKVICELAVNKLKDNQLGLEFVKNHYGQVVETGFGKTVEIFNEDAYKAFVQRHYAKSKGKRTKLLLTDIPEKMAERQLNDTRYISKFISSLLSNIVREEKNDDGINSKNVLPGNGKITSVLKQDWGLNDIWNDLILPRFERMNQLSGNNAFTAWNEQHQKFLPTVPLELSKGFQKKRIDHRNHALDALVNACATRDHINLLNNQSAKSDQKRYDLQRKLRHFEKASYFDRTAQKQREKDVPKAFIKPWGNFTVEAKDELSKIVVSFKQNLRVLNKATNCHEKWVKKCGRMEKVLVKQEGINWAIRKPLHKDTVFAKVSLRKIKKVKLKEALNDWTMIVDKELKKEIMRLISMYNGELKVEVINKYFKDRKYLFKETDISKVDFYYYETENAAVRKSLDCSFTEKAIKESVTDTGIQKILLNHLSAKENRPEWAFSPEGIEEMNKNIVLLNDGKYHQPIYKVRIYEPIGNKFQVGTTGNKKNKYVEAAKGTNLFFAIYMDDEGKRAFQTIPLNVVIENQKQGLPVVPDRYFDKKEYHLLFWLSPNDLVYVPTEEERENISAIDWKYLDKEQITRIYKIVSFTNSRLYAIPLNVATSIANKVEFTQLNKIEFIREKEYCIKLRVDYLGNISLDINNV